MSICYLFSYGTLQLESVQIASFGRKLSGQPDILMGYKIEQLEINDPAVVEKSGKKFHPIAVKSQQKEDYIQGLVFELTETELEKADSYEVFDYKRVLVKLKSGAMAWAYLKNVC